MRDIVDVERIILSNRYLTNKLFDCNREPFTRKFLDGVNAKFHIPPGRLRRIYELTRLYYIRTSRNLHNHRTLLSDFKADVMVRLTCEHEVSTLALILYHYSNILLRLIQMNEFIFNSNNSTNNTYILLILYLFLPDKLYI